MIRFVDSGDRISHGSDASIDNLSPFSLVMWFRPDTATLASGESQLAIKQDAAGNGRGVGRVGASNLGVGAYTSRGTGYDERTTTEFMTVGVAYFLAWTYSTVNKWRIYYGTESSAVAEATYDLTDQSGSGAVGSDAAFSLIIGGSTDLPDRVAEGDIGRVGYFADELLLANLNKLRVTPTSRWEGNFASCRLASPYTTTSDISDVTSNANDGTNTGGADAADPVYPRRYLLVRP